jgi:hypothetical protein
MKRLLVSIASLALLLTTAGVALAADGSSGENPRVRIAVNDDITVASGESADAVVVLNGNAQIDGTVNTVFVANGDISVGAGATLESLVVINGTADIAAGATIARDVSQLNSTVNVADGAQVGGSVRDLTTDAAAFGLFMGAAGLLLWFGAAIAMLLLGLVIAGLAARQLRMATGVISREPGKSILVGLAGVVIPPLLAVLAFITVIGIPASLGLLFVLWPAVAFAGYLVGAIWVGEWLLRRVGSPAAAAPRPYLATVVGLVVAFVLGFIPFVTAIISLFGLGAVVLVGWRTLFGTPIQQDAAPQQAWPTEPPPDAAASGR